MKYCTANYLQNMSHSVRILRFVSVYKTAPPTAPLQPFAFFPPWSPLRPPEVSMMLSSFCELSERNQLPSSVI